MPKQKFLKWWMTNLSIEVDDKRPLAKYDGSFPKNEALLDTSRKLTFKAEEDLGYDSR